MQNEAEVKRDIKSMLPEEIAAEVKALGEPAFRAKQIFKWLSRGVKSFEEMSDISKGLRAKLEEKFFITSPTVVRKQVSKIDGTIKYLWSLYDGNTVESVVMHYEYGNTICVSTQVGCRMGCAFCASTIGGKIRDMLPGEILDQIIFAEIDSGKKISNIVLMGIGEPLDNFDNVIRFLQLVNHKDGVNIGMRHITLSTCGLTEKVDRLSDYHIQLTLSVSLHAPDDETRSKIMPINRKYSVDQVIEACKRYFDKTGRRVSFEYAMINGVNDSDEHARTLCSKIAGMGAHVNLIPLNEVEESPLKPSSSERIKSFISILEKNGVNVTVRRKLGSDIDASCGQLKRKTASCK